MSPEHRSPSPQTSRSGPQRIAALDAARGLAILGMIVVNVGPRNGASIAEVIYRAPYGRASLLFVLLGGIGFALLTRKARQQEAGLPWVTLLWRAGLLLAAGLLLQELDHGIRVILTIYAALFLIGLPLARVRGKLLLLLTGLSLGLGPVVLILLQQHTDKGLAREPVTAADPPWEIVTGILLTGPYPAVVWAAPFLFGMWLGRQDLSDPLVSTRLIVWGAGAALGARAISLGLIWFFGEPSSHLEWLRLVSDVAHSEMPLWVLGSTGAATFVLGLCLKVRDWSRPGAKQLATLGRIALTAYTAHLLIIGLLVRPGPETLIAGLLVSAALGAGLILLAHLWLYAFSRGPFEYLLQLPMPRPGASG